MGGNKDNMRQAMKELLGLVGFGPEETEDAKPVERKPEPKPVVQERPVEVPEKPKVPEKPVAQERPVVQERPVAPERPKAPEPPVIQQPRIEREPAVERKEPIRPAAPVYRAPEPKAPEVELEETRQKVASTVERSFFPFGKPKAKEQPVYQEPYTPPVTEQRAPVEDFSPVEEEPIRPPFIRPDRKSVV